MDTNIQMIAGLISFNKDYFVENSSSLLPMRKVSQHMQGSHKLIRHFYVGFTTKFILILH